MAADNNISEDGKKKTKYDLKMEKRKAQEAKDKRNAVISKTICGLLVAVIVAGVLYFVISGIINKQKAFNDTYVMINEESVNKVEYDYYYNAYINQFMSYYSSIIQYMGLDMSKPFDEQEYKDGMTWKDMFDEGAVNNMISTFSAYNDAKAKGFVFDTAAGYKEYTDSLEANAKNANMTVAQYYKQLYGEYATADIVKPLVEKELYVEAYYNDLVEKNAPTDAEIMDYYSENKSSYDTVSYHVLDLTAVLNQENGEYKVSEEEIKDMAEEMAARVKKGEDFEALCEEYAIEEKKELYTDTATEYSYKEDAKASDMESVYRAWLYDEERKSGDVEVIEDSDNLTQFVVRFDERKFVESCKSDISSLLSNDKASEYLEALTENYKVTDVKGELKYLTIEETEATQPETEEGTVAETEETTVAESETEETTAAN